MGSVTPPVSAIISDRDGKGDTGASNIFVGTASSANLDGYVNNPVADLKAKVKITQAELDQIPSGFYGKDLLVNETITYDDLLYAMLLPSSNAACVVVARNVGELILRSKNL